MVLTSCPIDQSASIVMQCLHFHLFPEIPFFFLFQSLVAIYKSILAQAENRTHVPMRSSPGSLVNTHRSSGAMVPALFTLMASARRLIRKRYFLLLLLFWLVRVGGAFYANAGDTSIGFTAFFFFFWVAAFHGYSLESKDRDLFGLVLLIG
ncbi:hypothetical protein MPH_03297 [Macrophomina phaseolina MS6]|uniref:Uncharacterized protein n=1 Tax=Macrophomina phaseolina (strain MS6) TaxID=1126212 RepID=K2SAL5_MACPH|nr:hypothetical protein MPH_03297 [Macrophomina phaseolina MS6]